MVIKVCLLMKAYFKFYQIRRIIYVWLTEFEWMLKIQCLLNISMSSHKLT